MAASFDWLTEPLIQNRDALTLEEQIVELLEMILLELRK